MNITEKMEKIESNKQNILSLENENEELAESIDSTTFKVKVESVAFGYNIAKKGDVVSMYDYIGTFTKLRYNDEWKMFSYSELELLFEEI